nr:anthranilate synthase alpha subunit 2, chloroplastic-like isoform X3 [Malus domestica]
MTSQSSLVALMERPSPSNVYSADESEKFVEASKKGNLIPLSRSIFSDHLTPVLAYRCLVKEDDRDAPSFLFESVEPGSNDSNVGRYSVIGAQPSIEIVAKENMVTIMDHREGCRTEEIVEDPMTVPRRIMEGWTPQLLDELPEAFCGGWVGYFSYDTVRYVEKKKLPFPSAPPDDRNLPDVHLGLYDDVIVFDHVDKKTITNRPLAGTVRRGKTPKEDLMLEKQLLNDEKQCAEHIMLVDLGRNDVGKVSKPGSVKVEELMNIERYSHVMHISSTVTGELLDDLTSWDVLRTALPVGTVSGAPKVKAMELIDKLEVTRRGPYSGGFGGISFSGNMDIALALRTIVFPTSFRYDTMYSYKDANKRREWVAHLQAGAGIVADSDPADEQRECENKAAALARAIDLAESSFVDN